ncbi:hypothetical protein L202_07068 [Cryptococcus amylolentus CBS 6039]|uniref:Glycosyl hydrolase family 43 protein n=1 Tax=Cryptococcus amylolentus CBS 6039 TaxID=1295533 RepID=A0A1E3HF43_9TREE|nr:hypothetical protein L202_07068 [Cryptococcus amylolentus CBS 6039]ODN74745.1 hypothetical protein L202_07068 [Cryptococcus amylolentus CBS 6039]
MLTRVLLLSLVVALFSFVQAAQFSNPIRNSGPDPFIVYDGVTKKYYLMSTTGKDLRLVSSSTLGGLKDGTNTQVYTSDAEQKSGKVWAGGKSSSFPNPSLPLDKYPGPPVKLSDYFGIDGTVLKYSGKNYFVWSCHTDNPSADSLCICPLTNPTTLDWAHTGVISYPRADWEKQGGASINEGPSALYWGGQTYLTFSASHCKTASYSLGLLHLTGSDPLDFNSWTKTEGPVFQSGNGEYGPGHNAIFTSPDGKELWNVYHAVTNSAGSCGTDRQTFAQPVDLSQFSAKGPLFGTPLKKGQVINGPSGE